MKIKILLMLLISLFIVSCNQIEGNIPQDKSELEPRESSGFSLVFKINSKAFLPDIQFDVSKIVIQLNGPNGEYDTEKFILSETESIKIDELSIGKWNIHIDGYNSSDFLLADWDGSAVVVVNVNTVIEVVLKPIEGQGSLNFKLSWPAGEFETPILTGELISDFDEKTPITFIQGDNSYSANVDLPSGNYYMFLSLYDGENNKIWDKTSSVLIVANEITNADFVISLGEGGLNVDIVIDLPRPIDLTLIGTRDILGVNESLIVYAIPENNENCTYSWYVNSIRQEAITGNSFVIGDSGVSFEPGNYQIDVIAQEGNNRGSDGFLIKIIETGNSDSDSMVADYTMVDASGLDQADLDLVRQKKIMMMHASVGGNVIVGLKDLAIQDSERYSLNFTRQSNDSNFDEFWYEEEGGAFGDYYMGSINGYPQQKLDFFDTTLKTNDLGNKVDIVFFKFCYVDGYLKNEISTPEELFNKAKAKYEELESLFPNTIFVWVTMPVTLICYNNYYAYDSLVREYCEANNKYLLDIANIESHSLTGEYNGTEGECEQMTPEYTYDSGHLNELGRIRVANALWHLLVDIAKNN